MSKMNENKAPRPPVLSRENYHLAAKMDDLMKMVRSDVRKNVRGRSVLMPRFGDVSALASQVNVFVYDHPFFQKLCPTAFTDGHHVFFNADFMKHCLKEEQEQTQDNGHITFSLLPIVLHEFYHILYLHHQRCQNLRDVLPPNVAGDLLNRGFDTAINPRIYKAHESKKFGTTFTTHLGMDDVDRYASLSEEQIIQGMLNDLREQKDNQNPQDQSPNQSSQGADGQPGGGGDSNDAGSSMSRDEVANKARQKQQQSSGSDAGSGEDANNESDVSADGAGQPGNADASSGSPDGQPSSNGASGAASGASSTPEEAASRADVAEQAAGNKEAANADSDDVSGNEANRTPEQQQAAEDAAGDAYKSTRDVYTTQELARLMEENLHKYPELRNVMDRLELPSSNNVKGHEKMASKQVDRVRGAVATRKSAERRAGVSAPGSHMNEHTEQSLAALDSPKMRWKAALRSSIIGSGMSFGRSYDSPDKIYYIDPEMMGVNIPIWAPAEVPQTREDTICVIVDTSGSVSDSLLKEFLTEIRGMSESDDDINVVFMSADTVLRGEPEFFSAEDLAGNDGVFSIRGRGGTNIRDAIINAVDSSWGRERAFSKIVYFSDLQDYPPMRDQLPEVMPPVVFVAPEEAVTDAWIENTQDYAISVPLTSDMEIDLEEVESLSDAWAMSAAP